MKGHLVDHKEECGEKNVLCQIHDLEAFGAEDGNFSLQEYKVKGF